MANVFEACKTVEMEGRRRLDPFISERTEGRIYLDKGALSLVLQKSMGDAILQVNGGEVMSLELKCERGISANLFVETFSNINLADEANWYERGMTTGNALNVRCSLFGMFFLNEGQQWGHFFVGRWFKTLGYLYGDEPGKENFPRLYRYPLKKQRKHIQKNDTRGHCVPLHVLVRELGWKHFLIGQNGEFGGLA